MRLYLFIRNSIMRKTLTVLTVLLFVSLYTTAQTSEGTHAAKVVYLEGGFPGLLSVNYDMRFEKKQDGLGFRAGVGGWSVNKSTLLFVPVGINYITSKNMLDYFEAGAGVTFVSNSNAKEGETGPLKQTFGFVTLGYRKQPADGGFFWKAALVPIFGKGFFVPYAVGAGLGYTF
jgi:hypothetical protein